MGFQLPPIALSRATGPARNDANQTARTRGSDDFRRVLADATSGRKRTEKSEPKHDSDSKDPQPVADSEKPKKDEPKPACKSDDTSADAAAELVAAQTPPTTLPDPSLATRLDGETPAPTSSNAQVRVDQSVDAAQAASKCGDATIGAAQIAADLDAQQPASSDATVEADSTEPNANTGAADAAAVLNEALQSGEADPSDSAPATNVASAIPVDALPPTDSSDDSTTADPATPTSTSLTISKDAPPPDQAPLPAPKSAGDRRPVPASGAEASANSRTLRPAAQVRPSDTTRAGETVFEQRVRRSNDGRQEGTSGCDMRNSDNNSTPDAAATVVAPERSSSDVSRISAGVPTARISAVKIESGTGDGPPAAIARFLVHGDHANERVRTSAADRFPAHLHNAANGAPSAPIGGAIADVSADSVAPSNLVNSLLAVADDKATAIENIARVLHNSPSPGKYDATMRLDPPDLGQLKVQVRMDAEVMTLHVQAESQGVSKLIESRLSDLRDSLAAHGIRIERADVVVKAPDTGESQNRGLSNRNEQPGHHSSGDSPSSFDQARHGSDGGWQSESGGWSGRGFESQHWADGGFTDSAMSASGGEVEAADELVPVMDGSVDLVA